VQAVERRIFLRCGGLRIGLRLLQVFFRDGVVSVQITRAIESLFFSSASVRAFS
jgi:hypothetical protein